MLIYIMITLDYLKTENISYLFCYKSITLVIFLINFVFSCLYPNLIWHFMHYKVKIILACDIYKQFIFLYNIKIKFLYL